jgi:predicted transcriptional regulator
MKAIIEVNRRGSIFDTAAEQIAAARAGAEVDYRLGFESARALFSEVTPERLEILDTLRRVGRCRAEALAGQLPAPRDSHELTEDIDRLETLGLLERAQDQVLSVPFESIEIRLPLARVA